MTANMVRSFFAADGEYKLAFEREPPVRCPSGSGSCTRFSWAPALPGDEADAGFLLYNVGENLIFNDQRAASGEQPELLQLRARVVCHDLHWCESSRGGGRDGSSPPVLEALIGLSNGELLTWRPLNRKELPRPALVAAAKGESPEPAVSDLKWRPQHDSCFAAAHASGRLVLFDRRRSDEAPSASTSSKRTVRVSASLDDSRSGD